MCHSRFIERYETMEDGTIRPRGATLGIRDFLMGVLLSCG